MDLSGNPLIVACTLTAVACIDLVRRSRNHPSHLLFSVGFGSALSLGIMRTVSVMFSDAASHNGFLAALLIVMIALGWRALFGPWESHVKATMLGTFLFWIALSLISREDPHTRSVHLIAAAVALLPAVIWCMLFLKYHTERIANVVLLFLSGMLSTVPILFYDALVRRGVELQFFLLRVTPQSFNATSQSLVNGHLSFSGTKAVLVAGFVTFLIVGLIEEVSKYWMVSRSAKQLFSSIDDVMQLSIIVAIGFSFAENIINPVYFTAFVRDYLFHGAAPDLSGFFSNVLGRSVLTSMVHIVSTGVMGYFFGLAIFAGPVLAQKHSRGRVMRFLTTAHRLFGLTEIQIYRMHMLLLGLVCAIVLHALFNFLVSIPDMLPGNPQSLGDLLPSAPAFFSRLPLLLAPSLLYVVGGFWLLTSLFVRKENMEERGHLVVHEDFVS